MSARSWPQHCKCARQQQQASLAYSPGIVHISYACFFSISSILHVQHVQHVDALCEAVELRWAMSGPEGAAFYSNTRLLPPDERAGAGDADALHEVPQDVDDRPPQVDVAAVLAAVAVPVAVPVTMLVACTQTAGWSTCAESQARRATARACWCYLHRAHSLG